MLIVAIFLLASPGSSSQDLKENTELDKQVRKFLDDNRYRWRDMNVPAIDGQLLYNIILDNGYTRALEIGTSTGHSGIWIAWALSKTGGKLITIEIDKRRHKEALENYVDPKLVVGGCFTAHNVTERRSRYSRGQNVFLDYVQGLDNYETSINSSGSGVSISYKKSK
ncbi:MAG TPA: methyltransferase [Bacteroidales bacterium]|nr:methyltransferase [Bacteroidales bacterium]